MRSIWIIDDDRSIRWVFEKALERENLAHKIFDSAEAALEALDHDTPGAILTDIRIPGMDGLAFMEKVKARLPRLPVIVMTAYSDLDSAVSAFSGGAFEYLPKPFDVNYALELIHRALEDSRREQGGVGEASLTGQTMLGQAPVMQDVFRAIGRLALSHATVLITGETGTGKELVARALHRHSPRGDKPFIALNTAAIPRDLLESELFGHERGAFTGSTGSRRGRFEQADGGTLFLDEIGDMPSNLQTRLLRVLADGEFYRVGGMAPIKVDVRIIAATHQNLEQLVREGRFREDLFHRLNVIRIQLPALRNRREDIPLLMRHFLAQAARELSCESKVLLPDAVDRLQQLDWPGNVRQLENTARWLTVMASGKHVHAEDLPPELNAGLSESVRDESWEQGLRRWARQRLKEGREGLLDTALPAFERILIQTALEQTGGRRQDAARLLGWGRNTLTRKLKELRLEPDLVGDEDGASEASQ